MEFVTALAWIFGVLSTALTILVVVNLDRVYHAGTYSYRLFLPSFAGRGY